MSGPGSTEKPEFVRDFVVRNQNGLHARPAAQLVETAGRFASEVLLEKDGFEATAKSILSILSLEGQPGAVITVRTAGTDAREAMEAMAILFEGGFIEDALDGTESEGSAAGA